MLLAQLNYKYLDYNGVLGDKVIEVYSEWFYPIHTIDLCALV